MKFIATLLLLAGGLAAQTSMTVLPQGTDTVFAGSTRTLYGFSCAGAFSTGCTTPSNPGIAWSCTGGSLDTSGAPEYVKWTAPNATGNFSCTATAQDGSGAKASKAFTVIADAVVVDTAPFNVTLFKGQAQAIHPFVSGTTNLNVSWSISGPVTSGVLTTTTQDAVFQSSTPGSYQITATSVADPSKTSTTYITVTSNSMPALPLVNGLKTEPVDCTQTGSGSVYEVVTNADFDAVPWHNLKPGDLVRLHWSATPITRIAWIGDTPGTRQNPIRVCGVYDPTHGLPVMSGDHAQMAAGYTMSDGYTNGSTLEGDFFFGVYDHTNHQSSTTLPNQNFIIEGITFAHAVDPTYITNGAGYQFYNIESHTLQNWSKAAACLTARNGRDILFRGNEMTDCGNGFYSNDYQDEGDRTMYVTVQGNWLHGNSNNDPGGKQHTAYMEGSDFLVQGNYFDLRRPEGTGSTLKARFTRGVTRYNYLSPGARILDLVEPENIADNSNCGFCTNIGDGAFTPLQIAQWEEEYNSYQWVYGNIIVNNDNGSIYGPPSPVHYAADDGALDPDGTLLFYHNSWYQTATNYYNYDLFAIATSGSQYNNMSFAEGYTDVANNAIFVAPLPGGQTWNWGNQYDIRTNLRTNFISSTWCTDATQANCGKTFNAGDGVAVPNGTAQATYQNGNAKIRLTGAGNLLNGGTAMPFSTGTFAPASVIVGVAGQLHPAAQQMPPLMQYDMSRFIMVPRASAADLGAIGVSSAGTVPTPPPPTNTGSTGTGSSSGTGSGTTSTGSTGTGSGSTGTGSGTTSSGTGSTGTGSGTTSSGGSTGTSSGTGSGTTSGTGTTSTGTGDKTGSGSTGTGTSTGSTGTGTSTGSTGTGTSAGSTGTGSTGTGSTGTGLGDGGRRPTRAPWRGKPTRPTVVTVTVTADNGSAPQLLPQTRTAQTRTTRPTVTAKSTKSKTPTGTLKPITVTVVPVSPEPLMPLQNPGTSVK